MTTTTIATKLVRIEFGGGLELLFSNQKSHKVNIPVVAANDKPTDVNYLILWLRDNLLKEREELFLDNKTV
jgi:ubiquitin related modifier 1